MKIHELTKWLRDNSSGIYRSSAEAADLIEKMQEALTEIASYGKDGDGICPYGCDCPNIAQEALKWE